MASHSWGEWWLRTSFVPFRMPGQVASPSGRLRSVASSVLCGWGRRRREEFHASPRRFLCVQSEAGAAWSPAASNLALARAQRRGQAQKDVEIHVYQPGSSELTSALFDDELAYEHYRLHDSEDAPPLKLFDAQPVYGKKAVVVHIQPESETQCSVLFGGGTWSRRK